MLDLRVQHGQRSFFSGIAQFLTPPHHPLRCFDGDFQQLKALHALFVLVPRHADGFFGFVADVLLFFSTFAVIVGCRLGAAHGLASRKHVPAHLDQDRIFFFAIELTCIVFSVAGANQIDIGHEACVFHADHAVRTLGRESRGQQAWVTLFRILNSRVDCCGHAVFHDFKVLKDIQIRGFAKNLLVRRNRIAHALFVQHATLAHDLQTRGGLQFIHDHTPASVYPLLLHVELLLGGLFVDHAQADQHLALQDIQIGGDGLEQYFLGHSTAVRVLHLTLNLGNAHPSQGASAVEEVLGDRDGFLLALQITRLRCGTWKTAGVRCGCDALRTALCRQVDLGIPTCLSRCFSFFSGSEGKDGGTQHRVVFAQENQLRLQIRRQHLGRTKGGNCQTNKVLFHRECLKFL